MIARPSQHAGRRPPTRRAVTLIEAVAVVLVLALAVPPALEMMTAAETDRADAATIARATALAAALAEAITADSASPAAGLGPAAFDDLAAYLDTPTTGLRDRLGPIASHYAAFGITWDLDAEPVSAQPLAVRDALGGDAAAANLRLITITVTFPSARGGTIDTPLTLVVGGRP